MDVTGQRAATGVATTVVDDLVALAENDPDRVAVISYPVDGPPVELTYRQLLDRVDRIAAGLLRLGVRPDDTVSFQLPNGWHFLAVYLAVARIGAVANPVLPILRRREVEFILRRTASSVFIAPEQHRRFAYGAMARELQRDIGTLQHVLVVGGEKRSDSFEVFCEDQPSSVDRDALAELRPAPQDVAEIMFTSGTTGEPKGVIHTYESMIAGIRCVPELLGIGRDDVVLMFSPLAHGTGFFYGVIMPVAYGIPVVYQDGWDPATMLDLAQRHTATWTMGTSAFVLDACDAAEATGRRLNTLRYFVCAGAPIPPVAVRRAADALGAELVAAWGMTEVGIGSMTRPGDSIERVQSSDGCAVPGVELNVVGDDGQPLPTGDAGRLLIRCAGQHRAYLDRRDLYDAGFVDGWFDTGDVARMDSAGYIRIAGRTKDLVIRGGENIPVVEVEGILREHPLVRDVAIVAVPDQRLGERACAVVVTADRSSSPFTMHKMRSFLESKAMAKQFWPEYLELRTELPRTASGKVRKTELRDELRSKYERTSNGE